MDMGLHKLQLLEEEILTVMVPLKHHLLEEEEILTATAHLKLK